MATLNEFDVLKRNLPLCDNIGNYLCVKTKVKFDADLEFRLEVGLEKIVRKFGHSGWMEMKPLVVGIKCYTESGGAIWVQHSDRNRETTVLLDSFEVQNEVWNTFKFPLLANYHTDTRILLSGDITAYTLAILNVSQRIRYDHTTNDFPSGYASFEKSYNSFNKALVYVDGDKTINPSSTSLEKSILVNRIQSKI